MSFADTGAGTANPDNYTADDDVTDTPDADAMDADNNGRSSLSF